MVSFKLRFPIADIEKYAAAYDTKRWRDDQVEPLARAARKRGYFTKKEFLALCAWKSPRTKPRCEKNDESFVREVTGIALTTTVERLRIEVLTLLDGVYWPTASVFLHLGHEEQYPILDFRALESLSSKEPHSGYSFEFWEDYFEECRRIADLADVDMRTLDRALWQFSKDKRLPV